MTKPIESKIDLHEKAAEHALKEALKSDNKTLDDKARFKQAYEKFFESYDTFIKQG